VDPKRMRFRQHLQHEMAHYAGELAYICHVMFCYVMLYAMSCCMRFRQHLQHEMAHYAGEAAYICYVMLCYVICYVMLHALQAAPAARDGTLCRSGGMYMLC
jgi:glycyl-tRNA synthetase (class II)